MATDTALIVLDMLNPYDHEDSETLAGTVEAMAGTLGDLIDRATDTDLELIYVNDNYGDFTATRDDLERAAKEGRRPDLIEPILPPPGVAFLQKARHSAFYSTALDHLLRQHSLDTIVLTGQVTEQCVLYTALDAYIRHFKIRVVQDAVAHIDEELGHAALRMMERNMGVELIDAADVI